MLKVEYTASPCIVNLPAPRKVQHGARQSRQRGTGIVRSGNVRKRISGEFFEVLDYVVAHLNGKKEGTC